MSAASFEQLKKECKSRGLPVGRSRDTCIQRLQEWKHQKPSAPSPGAGPNLKPPMSGEEWPGDLHGIGTAKMEKTSLKRLQSECRARKLLESETKSGCINNLLDWKKGVYEYTPKEVTTTPEFSVCFWNVHKFKDLTAYKEHYTALCKTFQKYDVLVFTEAGAKKKESDWTEFKKMLKAEALRDSSMHLATDVHYTSFHSYYDASHDSEHHLIYVKQSREKRDIESCKVLFELKSPAHGGLVIQIKRRAVGATCKAIFIACVHTKYFGCTNADMEERKKDFTTALTEFDKELKRNFNVPSGKLRIMCGDFNMHPEQEQCLEPNYTCGLTAKDHTNVGKDGKSYDNFIYNKNAPLGHAPKCRVLNSKDLGVPDDMFSQYKWDHYPITFTIHC